MNLLWFLLKNNNITRFVGIMKYKKLSFPLKDKKVILSTTIEEHKGKIYL
jgi:hypothetical protein